MWLAYHHNSESGRCDPSVELLAKESCMTTRSVGNALKELKQNGHIQCEGSQGKRYKFKLNPRTTFTPEGDSPPNHVPITPEGDSDYPRTTFRLPPNHVPINSNEQEDEQEIKSKQEKTSKRKMNEDDFRQACSVELDFTASQKLKAVWSQWQLYRVKTNSGKRPWTEQAANIAKKNLKAWAEKHGDEAVIAKVEYAISSTHQTFFEPTPPIQFNRNQKPQPTRYTGAGI